MLDDGVSVVQLMVEIDGRVDQPGELLCQALNFFFKLPTGLFFFWCSRHKTTAIRAGKYMALPLAVNPPVSRSKNRGTGESGTLPSYPRAMRSIPPI